MDHKDALTNTTGKLEYTRTYYYTDETTGITQELDGHPSFPAPDYHKMDIDTDSLKHRDLDSIRSRISEEAYTLACKTGQTLEEASTMLLQCVRGITDEQMQDLQSTGWTPLEAARVRWDELNR